MAQMEVENRKKSHELKHLGFVKVAAFHAILCVSSLYDFAKRNSGPLRSTVGTVEGAVATVVGPVYDKFNGVPADLLAFVDEKVDKASREFEKHAPTLAKRVACQAHELFELASSKGQQLIREAQTGGPRAAFHYAMAESKHLVVTQGVKAWVKLNEVPSFHKVADMAVPTAAHWSNKYNHTIKEMASKGYPVFGYLPLVPVDEIAKTFKQGKAAEKKEANGVMHQSSSDSE